MRYRARTESLMVKALGDEMVAYDERRHEAHELNSAATAIWRRCAEPADITEISAYLHSTCGLPDDVEVAALGVDGLVRAGLVEMLPEGPKESAAADMFTSRRKLTQRLGIALALLPLVTTVLAPTPAMAASTPP